MTPEKPEETMTFGELLTLIADQQHRLSVLENAFLSLSASADENASQRLINHLRQEAQKEDDENRQRHFSRLADELEKRHDRINISHRA
ncbi:hypothetical protein AAH446_04030 [Erwinia sp. P6884]|uniref:hypothetical protein n=1 Tax=Erwinia sp. P6884 TaxID=3141450 RepID=UPI00318CB17B